MANPFERVNYKGITYNIKAITKHEFDEVIKAINTATPYQYLGGTGREKKSHYRNYLIDGLKLSLYTGLRREEVVTLTWNNVFYSEKAECLMLVVKNLKVERQKGEEYAPKYVPVNPDLMDLLIELGYNDLQDSNLRLLDPFGDASANTMMVCLTKGFGHYYKQAFPEKKSVCFKVLRKTYLSYLNKAVGDKMIDFSSHSGMEVVKTHYLDKQLTAKVLKSRMFE